MDLIGLLSFGYVKGAVRAGDVGEGVSLMWRLNMVFCGELMVKNCYRAEMNPHQHF